MSDAHEQKGSDSCRNDLMQGLFSLFDKIEEEKEGAEGEGKEEKEAEEK